MALELSMSEPYVAVRLAALKERVEELHAKEECAHVMGSLGSLLHCSPLRHLRGRESRATQSTADTAARGERVRFGSWFEFLLGAACKVCRRKTAQVIEPSRALWQVESAINEKSCAAEVGVFFDARNTSPTSPAVAAESASRRPPRDNLCRIPGWRRSSLQVSRHPVVL